MDLARDISAGEKVEAELNVFITRRHEKRVAGEGERQAEEMWRESVARFNERAQAEIRSRWIEYHQNLCRLHTQLATKHEEKAQRLLEGAA